MRSIGKQFSHTIRFQHEELVDAKSSTSKILPLVIVAVYLVTACHGMSRHIGSQIFLSRYMSYSHIILLSRYMSYSHIILLSRYIYHIKMRNTTLLLQPPTPSPSQRPSRSSLTANLFIITPPPPRSSVLMSTCTYFCVRQKLKETILDCHSEFIRHHLLLVSQNYESFKHGMQNMGKVNELKYCILTLTNFPEAYNFFCGYFGKQHF